MKYTGRLVFLLVIAISFILGGMTHPDNQLHFVLLIALAMLGWWLGKQYDKVRYYSAKDPLTNLYNRRYIEDIFPRLKKAWQNRPQKLFVFFIDVDNFKFINDSHDHETGDLVLLKISQILSRTFRKHDYVARWGGDEFLVIFPCEDESVIHGVFNRFKHNLKILSNEFSTEIFVSIGYAVYPDDGIHLADLIRVADKKMYGEKQSKTIPLNKC